MTSSTYWEELGRGKAYVFHKLPYSTIFLITCFYRWPSLFSLILQCFLIPSTLWDFSNGCMTCVLRAEA
uniref:Uncharacterized protein n=3 Tax=Anas TaxID=8835 RepID=A0A493TIN6_ANAPP